MRARNGKHELPLTPVCGPGEHWKAKAHLLEIDKALDEEGWSTGQRRCLNEQRRRWWFRAEGRDAFFERHGNIPRHPNAPPPKPQDVVMAKWRQDARRKEKELRAGMENPKKIRELEKKEDMESDN